MSIKKNLFYRDRRSIFVYIRTGDGPRIKYSIVHQNVGGKTKLVGIVRDIYTRLLLPRVVQDPRTTCAETVGTLARSLLGRGNGSVPHIRRRGIGYLSQERPKLFQVSPRP